MSYRELRNFCEQMRALGYPRIISIENFRRPNFELVADILYWLAQRYDPHIEISDNIDEERHRVEFIKQITQLFVAKARIKINPKKLYQSDGYAVQEMLKISTFLYKAQICPPKEEDELHDFALPSKLSNVKGHKAIAQEITELGAKLYDQLGKEKEVRQQRDKALNFLDNISRSANSEQTYIQKQIGSILQQQEQSINEMKTYVTNLEKDQKTLEERIKRRTRELEQSEKRLKGMISVKPAYQEEYERLEMEMERIYSIYIEKFRNLDYLEHMLDMQNVKDQEKIDQMEKKRKKLKKKIQDEEMEIIRGDKDLDENLLEAQLNGKGESRLESSMRGRRDVQSNFQNFHKGGDELDQDEDDGLDGELEEGDEEEDENDDGIDDLDDDDDQDDDEF